MAQVQISFQDVDAAGKPAKLVSFVGQLDETNVDEEAQKIYQVIQEMAQPYLILDFSGLEYMNSKSIGYVTDWYSRVMAKGGKMVIASPKNNILDILKVVGITQIVNIYENIDQAKQALTKTDGEENPTPSITSPSTPVTPPAVPAEEPVTPPTEV